MTGGGRLRRGGRRVRRLPILGEPIRDVYAWTERTLWTHLLTPGRGHGRAVANRVRDFVNGHAWTARNVTRRNTRRAYDRLYASDKLLGEYLDGSRLAFYDAVADAVVAHRPRSVLDAGCGSGHLLRAIERRDAAVELHGVDYSRNAVRRAARVAPNAVLAVSDLRSFEPGRTYDLVVCTEVLEHVADAAAARGALARLVRPGGTVVVTVPDGEHDDWEGHVNFWTLDELAGFLAPVGDVEVSRLGEDVLLGVVSAGGPPQP